MKIIPHKPKEFQPFSILVETQEDANFFASIIGNCTNGVYEKFGVNIGQADKLYSALSSSANHEVVVDITIDSNENT